MKWTLEEENRLAILLSIIDIGDYGTKEDVLNNIQDKKYLNITPEDLKMRPIGESSEEPIWRNNLAFTRKHLVMDGFIDDSHWNEWRITQTGKAHFCSEVYDRLRELTKSNPLKPLKLTYAFYREIKNRIRKICPAMKENYWDKLPPEVFN